MAGHQSILGPLPGIYHGAGRLLHGHLPTASQAMDLSMLMPGPKGPRGLLSPEQVAATREGMLSHPGHRGPYMKVKMADMGHPALAHHPAETLLMDMEGAIGQGQRVVNRKQLGLPPSRHPQGQYATDSPYLPSGARNRLLKRAAMNMDTEPAALVLGRTAANLPAHQHPSFLQHAGLGPDPYPAGELALMRLRGLIPNKRFPYRAN
jgi:hypothetical protein